MVPFPSEPYMRALAEAIYAVSYLEWAILGDLPRLTDQRVTLTVAELSRDSLGKVGKRVRQAAETADANADAQWLAAAADALEQVVGPRNAVIHAHPATVDGEQVLYRWAAADGRSPHEAFPITLAHLEQLRDLAYTHLRRLNGVRLSRAPRP